MKILIPIDFSECSKNALRVAKQFIDKRGGEIHLFHSIESANYSSGLTIEKLHNAYISELIDQNLEPQINQIIDDFGLMSYDCKVHYSKGNFFANIEEIANQIDFDLIIMGSHGISGKREWFIGSNTQKAIRRLDNNVLIVKSQTKEVKFSKVTFLTALDEIDKEAFIKFLEFIEDFEVEEIHILAIDLVGFFSQPSFLIQDGLREFKALAKDYKVDTHFFSDYTVEAGVRHFSEALDIDLVAMANNKESALKRFFFGSNVEMILNHSIMPVLTIDYKK